MAWGVEDMERLRGREEESRKRRAAGRRRRKNRMGRGGRGESVEERQ
jgi:hypothetical protein